MQNKLVLWRKTELGHHHQFHVETLSINVSFTEPVRSSDYLVFICRMISKQWTGKDIEESKIGLILDNT
jgi:hypothetical protein